MIFKRRKQEPPRDPVTLEVAWGGYYAMKSNDGDWGVIRLLDFNTYAYHCSGYRERFTSVPSAGQVASLVPFALHLPISAVQLVTHPLRLIEPSALSEEALEGYRVYLQETQDLRGAELDHFIAKMIYYSKEPPISFRLALDADGVLQAEPV